VTLHDVAVQQIKSILMHGPHYEYLKFSIYTMAFYTNKQLHIFITS